MFRLKNRGQVVIITLVILTFFSTLRNLNAQEFEPHFTIGTNLTYHTLMPRNQTEDLKAAISDDLALNLIFRYRFTDDHSALLLTDCNWGFNLGYLYSPRIWESNFRFNLGFYAGPNRNLWDDQARENARKLGQNGAIGEGLSFGNSAMLLWPILGLSYYHQVNENLKIVPMIAPTMITLTFEWSY